MSRFRSVFAKRLVFFLAVFCLSSAVVAQSPSGDVVISADTTWPTASYNVTSLTVQSGATLTVGGGSTVTVANGVTVTGKSNIVMQGANNTGKVNGTYVGVGVTLQAGAVQVYAGSSISADAQGYLSSARRAEDGGANGGSGGSYGGVGGYVPGPIYGSASAPLDLGSGGAAAQYVGSNGGGAIRLIVSGTLTNNGTISANGQAVLPSQGGAGAGGSVYVTTATLAGSGSFTANGGSNTTPTLSGAAAGGGGRVAVYYAGPTTFTGFATSTASGGVFTGQQTGYAGTNGTAVFFDISVQNSDVSVYQSGFQIPANSTVQYNSMTIANGAAVTVGNGSTVVVADSLSVQSDALLTIGGGSAATVGNSVSVTGNSNIVMQGANNTGKVNGGYNGIGVTLQAGSMQVDAGSSINADAQGYLSSARRDDGVAAGGSGGSYGGLGGYSPGSTYGSASAPVDLGSGGAAAQYAGSNGGGAIRLIVSGTLTLNGTISANGQAVLPAQGGAGAGGSVYVTTGTLAGSGSFTANGGSNTTPTLSGAAAGGGGRVAVYYAGPTTFTGFSASTASGGVYTGTQIGNAGTNGTAVFFDTSAPNGNATVYQHYEVPANTTVQYNGLNVMGGALVTLGGGSQLSVAQALHVSGAITALSSNSTARNNGRWLGQGVVIAAGSVQIDATGTINADAQGYPQNAGPGAGGYTTGGSYGGQGAGQTAASVYGSTTAPIDLGSGGGSGQNNGGGAGGGAIELLSAGTITNNGVISANGGSLTNNGYGAGGSGGSIYVQANSIQGTGIYSANGGSNLTTNTAGGGGGGGRIAITYITNNGVSGSLLTVHAGIGSTPSGPSGSPGTLATDGTISFVQNTGLEWLKPTNGAVHGNVNLEWFTDTGIYTTVNAAGPQTSIIAMGGPGFSLATWPTTGIPDGAYELRLAVSDTAGEIARVSKNVVVNNSVTWVSGTLTANTHWTANHVYAIDGDVIVPSGITLTIDAGTVVKSLTNYQIIVQSGGTLTALGDASNPVIFTTFDDSTVGGNTNFGTGFPQAGEWGGISVDAGGTLNTNTNTFIRYGHGVLSSTITSNTTLFSSQVYEIQGNLTVTSGSSLTVQPGTVIKFDAGAGITVNSGAALFANGTLAQPIYFTSINDQSVGANLISQANPNAPPTAPAPGDWNNISINGTASFNFVHMLYGGGPIPTVAQTGMIQSGGSATTITIANSVLAYSYYIGIEADGGTTTISNSVFYANQDRAVNNFGTVHIVNSTFDGNAAGPFNHGGSMDIANSVVTGFTNTQFGGVGGNMTNFLNNDVYTATPGVPKYIGLADQTGMNGNISAAPVYMNGAQHDYRPTYGSPLIDAANGTVANYPLTDAFNDPRYNAPLVATKTGIADASGKYPDIGAFEFVQSAPSDLDLTPSLVQGPASAVVGAQVIVNWTVTNVGVGTVYGPWHDAVYLVRNPGTSPLEIYAGQVLSGLGVVLGPGATYNGSGTITVPGIVVGEHSWEVKTNVLGEVFEGANTANNKAVSLNPVQIDVPALTAGTGPVSGTFTSAGQSVYYKVIPAAAQTTRVQLALVPPTTGIVQLFVGGGYVPTPQHYDYQQVEFASPTASLVIPSGTTQTYYVSTYAQSILINPSAFTITATAVQFSLTSVSPNNILGVGASTLTFLGGGFTGSTTFNLVSSTGAIYPATSVFLADSGHAQATFSAAQIPTGTYTAQAVDGTTLTLVNAVTVYEPTRATDFSSDGTLQTSLQTPTSFRHGFPALVTLNYTNVSGSDLAAPMIYVSADVPLNEIPPLCEGCSNNLGLQYGGTFTSGLVLGINQNGVAGILPAGASGSISFLANPNTADSATFRLSTQTLAPIENSYVADCSLFPIGVSGPNCTQAFVKTGSYRNAADFCASMTPPGASAAGYTRACMVFFNKAGFAYIQKPGAQIPDILGVLAPPRYTGDLQFAGFNNVLAADATALSANGVREYDVQRLLAYEFQMDGAAGINARYHQGVFGFGPGRAFDITADSSSAGATIHFADGSTRVFTTTSSTQPGIYLGGVGDTGSVTFGNFGEFTLTEADGRLYHFPQGTAASRQLDYFQDRNGNKTTLTYANGLLASAQDAFGNTIAYQYDSLGHITQITDASGKVTTFTYKTLADAMQSTFLNSFTDQSGTTTLTWNQGGSHGVGYIDDTCVTTYCEPAIGIASIAYADNTHTYYQYDPAGRLIGRNQDGGAQAITYSYGKDGSISATDALGKTSRTVLSEGGVPAMIADALGNATHFRYDPENKPIEVVGPLGDSSSTGYDAMGNATSATSALGSTTTVSYGSAQNLTSVTDPGGSVTSYTYDANNNATEFTHPNGTQITSSFDAHGNVLSRTNRRGNTTTYTYLPNGLIASKTFANGTQVLYTYDASNNPQTVTTAAGSTRYTYNAANQVTSISNPEGTFLQFTYNGGGQRTRMTDSTGFVTNYTYDPVGRLATLTNAAGAMIVSYTYDGNGNLFTKTLANGTSANYTYNPNGQLTSVINRTAANAIQSEYDYTYDTEGNPVSLTAPSGNLTYAYDLDGQLTSATTATSTIQYEYDSTGNRTQVTANGAQRAFLSNSLNQYTAAGSSAYQYDLDGNMVSGDGYSYSYDDENHLIGMTKGSDTWTFQYDGMANRVGSVHNGVVTRYLIDPSGYGNMEAELDGSGAATAHYTYGLDLTTSIQASGTTSYYHFDGTGNTSQITNSSGNVVNSYAYLPFGEKSTLASGVANSFTYNGQWGVRDEGSGLYFMRNRWYNPSLGRFQQTDPIGLQSGINRYTYAGNSPVRFNDPLGLLLLNDGNASPSLRGDPSCHSGPDYLVVGATFFGGGGYTINVHNGKVYGGVQGSTGGGINSSAGYILSNAPESERAALTDSFLAGKSFNVSGYVGVGGGIVYSPGTGVALEFGVGAGGSGGGGGYSVPLDETPDPGPGRSSPPAGGSGCNVPPPPPPPPPAPCGSCLFKPGPPNTKPIQGSIDPNGKLTSGFGDLGFVPTGVPITYTIYFENQPTATLPAQKVVVTDALAANLDWSTVELNQVNFNNVSLTIPDGTQTYKSQANVSSDPNPVSVVAALNPATGVITWTLQSVDSITGGAPANPLAGFLPPNGASNAGVGSVVFTLQPKAGLTNGTAIPNQGSIIFDVNAPILTNTVTNTIDSSTVTSAIGSLPATFIGTSLPVSWSGSDGGGSGIASYNIYVSTDTGPYMLWLSSTTLATANYSVYAGHTFSFVSLAVNNVGIVQTIPATAQTVTVITPTPVVTVTPASTTISATQSLAVAIAVTGSSTPTGTVTLTSGAYTSASATLTSGNATILIPAGALANGIDTLTVTYTPDSAASSRFSSAIGTASITVGAVVISAQVSVGTLPVGQSFSVDGVAFTTPQAFTWTVGSVHSIATTSPQTQGGIQQTFSNWSDGGALAHSVTATSGVAAYTATFATSYLLTLASNPALGGTVTPATGTFYPAGTAVSLTAAPATDYAFTNWTGPVASSTTATTTVTMNAAQTVTANFTLIPVPVVSLSPGSLTFTTTAGVTSAAQTIQLANTGNAALNITGISIGGTGVSAFAQTNTCGASVAAGANCTISITFASTFTGSFVGTLSVSSNVTGMAPTVTLSGTATAPPTFTIAATPASQTVAAGATATYILNLAPQGGSFANAITLTATGLPSGTTATFSPASVTPGAAAASSILTIQVPAARSSLDPLGRSPTVPVFALLGCVLLATQRRLHRLGRAVLILVALGVLPILIGCASSSNSKSSPVTSTITVTGTSGSQTQTTTVTLTIQ